MLRILCLLQNAVGLRRDSQQDCTQISGFGSLLGIGNTEGYLSGGSGSSYGGSPSGGSSYSGSGSGGSHGSGSTNTIATGSISNNNGSLNLKVDSAAREKYTSLKGNGKDQVTVMVFMCGADLESSYGMGTSDLKEMTKSRFGDNLNLLVYTGGCRRWQNRIVSNSVNEIYRIQPGGLERLEDNFAKKSMTDPATLSAFIKYAAKNYPADRYDLIFWDHGSGTSGGYGHDERYSNTGTMSIAEIDQALDDAGIKFDFVGFDCCLMATLENALMLSEHADYMIASEETEPGTGWYYVNWLGALSSNTAVSTPELGKVIADDFLAASQQAGQGNEVTLSVTDLSELGETVPAAFTAFAKSISSLIDDNEYSRVAKARSSAKEFARSNKLDQIDVTDFAYKLGTEEGRNLSQVIKAAVKYNRTSRSYGDAHGLSIYFPYKRVSYLDRVTDLYKKLNLNSDYTKCIRKFANQEVSGQAAGGGTSNPYEWMSGYGGTGGSYGSSGYGGFGGSGYGGSSDELADLLMDILFSGSSYGRISGLGSANTKFLDEESVRSAAEYVADNHIDTSHLKWVKNKKGETVLAFDENDWEYVNDVELSVLYDDGEGYIDLGLDSILNYNDDDALLGEYDQTWLALNGNPVAFNHLETIDKGDEYSITGYVPVFVNDQLADLIIVFDEETPGGRVDSVIYRYENEDSSGLELQCDAVGKNALLQEGDVLTFICDYYTYDGEFLDNFQLGNKMTVDGEILVSNVVIGDRAQAAYCITDIYDQSYWTPVIE